MSNNKMLIDATHPEETRVVVLRNGRVEEFDYESAARKLLRGNIYLAKVTRVEPSLQAAFVEYGGNRHGFLAFNEIHPDYYQIPMADRQALLDEEAAAEAEEEAAADARAERMARRRRRPAAHADDDTAASREADEAAETDDTDETDETDAEYEAGDDEGDGEADDQDSEPATLALSARDADETMSERAAAEQVEQVGTAGENAAAPPEAEDATNGDELSGAPTPVGGVEDMGVQMVEAAPAEAETVEQVGSEDALEELPSRPRRRPRSYKIQEVIKRRQVILVQVVKEERGNKGAALTTYLSLAGRYTVLMPNTARGGGISRKITNPVDRKRLKAIAAELEVPDGMGLIIRTAGAARTKQEIKRDFEYLLRLWESVRDLTLQSTAPSLVYEEGNLIKRSIRDLYNKDIEEIVVAGEHAHHEAKDFMRMLMPSHAKNVMMHADPEPLFTRYGIERQLNAMFSPYVTLRSGGYLVINQTEALVAIDVNSGKSTREFSIEETAHNTNLEAADEIARQLKLRDLAGLIVIDFIDMEEKRNNRSVERRLKDALRFDRARIQLGRISHFGLMEMSRQRLRTGVLEGSTSQCPHCQGTGIIRSTESVALAVLRGLEDALMAGARTSLVATTTSSVAIYILNNKRQFINDMESRHGITITVQASDKLQGANFTIEKGHAPAQPVRRTERTVVNMDWGFEGEEEGAEEPVEAVNEADGELNDGGNGRHVQERGGPEDGRRRRRRRRGRRGGEGPRVEGGREERGGMHDDYRDDGEETGAEPSSDDLAASDDEPAMEEAGAFGRAEGGEHNGADADRGGRRRRRGRRGGRRGRGRDRSQSPGGAGHVSEDVVDDFAGAMEHDEAPPAAPERAEQPALRRHDEQPRPRRTRVQADVPPAPPVVAAAEPEARAQPRPRSRSSITSSEPKIERVVVSPGQEAGGGTEESNSEAPTRRGWWQRRFGAE